MDQAIRGNYNHLYRKQPNDYAGVRSSSLVYRQLNRTIQIPLPSPAANQDSNIKSHLYDDLARTHRDNSHQREHQVTLP